MAIFLIGLAIWTASGLTIAAILARQGHNFWILAIMGLGFGPFLFVIWGEAMHRMPSRVTVDRDSTVDRPAGWIDVLVGLDGSPHSVESAASVLATLGPAIGRIRFTSVIDHEIANAPEAFEVDDERIAFLRKAARELGHPSGEISLVSGRPDKALLEHATSNGFDIVVVAHRRHEVRGALRGSTVARLARGAELPVLIGPSI